MNQPLKAAVLRMLMRGMELEEDSVARQTIEEMNIEDIEAFAPVIDREIEIYAEALKAAERFMAGFENLVGLDSALALVRAAIARTETKPPTHTIRVQYRVLGGHTHIVVRTGLAAAEEFARIDFTMTNEEFEAWRTGNATIEFVEVPDASAPSTT